LVRVGVIAIGSVLLGACDRAEGQRGEIDLHAIAQQFVPHDAREIIDAPGVPWVQVSFVVSRAAKDFAIREQTLNVARRDGWSLCQPRTLEWMSYEDHSAEPARFIRSRTYLMAKAGVMVILIGMRVTENPITDNPADDGSDKLLVAQHGTVIAKQASAAEVKQQADAFDLVCQE
jgi:hypothetical protein